MKANPWLCPQLYPLFLGSMCRQAEAGRVHTWVCLAHLTFPSQAMTSFTSRSLHMRFPSSFCLEHTSIFHCPSMLCNGMSHLQESFPDPVGQITRLFSMSLCPPPFLHYSAECTVISPGCLSVPPLPLHCQLQ